MADRKGSKKHPRVADMPAKAVEPNKTDKVQGGTTIKKYDETSKKVIDNLRG